MSVYIILRGPRVGHPSAVMGQSDSPVAALRDARQLQHAESERRRWPLPYWVEREDGCILGGTYPWMDHGEHEHDAERLNKGRGFTTTEYTGWKRSQSFRCESCGGDRVQTEGGKYACAECGALAYMQHNGYLTRYRTRRCRCGRPAVVRMDVPGLKAREQAMCGGCAGLFGTVEDYIVRAVEGAAE